MLTNALRALVNNQFLESFDTTFMENEKTVKRLIVFYFFIKTFFKWITNYRSHFPILIIFLFL